MSETRADVDAEGAKMRPIGDLRSTGLLWLINRVVFHPRGFALGLNPEDGAWCLLGDGTEAWGFAEGADDGCFAAAEAFLGGQRKVSADGEG